METKEALQLLHKSFTEKWLKYLKLSNEQEDNVDLRVYYGAIASAMAESASSVAQVLIDEP